MVNKSYLTAITRKSLPVPVRWLILRGDLIYGDVLDYGCGKCAEINNQTFGRMEGVESITNYDPYYAPVVDDNKSYDTILCTYVLCALPKKAELPILRNIQSLLKLKPGGMAFISVRNDKPKNGHGYSSRGTFQRWVEIPYLRVLHKDSQARIYILTRHSEIP